MEDEACRKDLIYQKRKKRKRKFEENHLSDNDEERKSKSRKRKKSGNLDHEKNIYNEPYDIKVTKEIDKDIKIISRDNANDNVQSLNRPEILKKKKKKKVHLIENPNLKDNDDKCQNHDDMEFKKKKKSCLKDIENAKNQKVNENVDQRLPTETNTEFYNPETDTEIILSDIDKKKKKFNSKPRKSNSKQLTYEDFIYKPPVVEERSCGKIERIPDSCNYWLIQNSVYDVNNYPQEVIQKVLLERIEYITDYFDRFDSDNLTEKECQERELSNFNGPYLPTPQHIKYFSDLNIEIDWEVPAEQQLLFTYFHLRTVKKAGIPFVRYNFLKSEDKIMIDNWRKFQEQYKFYDLRPLLGFRTMRIHCVGGQYLFEKVEYLDTNERYKFLLYIARGLEKRGRRQVLVRMTQIAMRIQDNEIIYRQRYIEPIEVAEIEAFIRLFGANFIGMEFFLGRLNCNRYGIFSKIHIKYKNVPMRHGPWQSTEMSRLIRSIFRTTKANSIQELINSKVNWAEVFPLFQTRTIYHCQSYFKNHLKRKLEIASHMANHQTDVAKLYWTSNDLIKLLRLVSENLGPTCDQTDWDKISSHFEVFGPNGCRFRFQRIYHGKVPHKKRTSFREAVDYIITHVVPLIESGVYYVKGEDYTVADLRSLPLKKDQSTKSPHGWSLKDTIKLIKEVYEIAGSSVETTSWSEISSKFKSYDETSCRNHFRYLYYNRVPHKHRASFDSALEYLRKVVCPMLQQKKQRNEKEYQLTEEIVNLSTEDRSILQALQKDLSQADDDEDMAMLHENNEQLQGQISPSASVDCHERSLSQKITRMNELADFIQERQEEDEIDGDLEIFNENKVDSYLDDIEKEENEYLFFSSKDDKTDKRFLQDEKEICNNGESKNCGIGNESSDIEERKVRKNYSEEYKKKNLKHKYAKKCELRQTHDLSEEKD